MESYRLGARGVGREETGEEGMTLCKCRAVEVDRDGVELSPKDRAAFRLPIALAGSLRAQGTSENGVFLQRTSPGSLFWGRGVGG